MISQHRLHVDMLDGSRHDNSYISVMRLRDGQIAEVTEYYGSSEHARFLAALGVAA